MTESEVAFLLAAIYVYERRTDAVSKAQVAAWHQLLEDVDFESAKRAVTKHFTNSDRPMTVKQVRDGTSPPTAQDVSESVRIPEADPDDPRAFIRALRAGQWQPERNPEDYEPRSLNIAEVGKKVPIVTEEEVEDDAPRPRRWWLSRWGNGAQKDS